MLARKISASSGVSLGRNGRRPAGDLRAEVTAQHPPLQGEGRIAAGDPGWRDAASPTLLSGRHPHPAASRPTSPLQGEVVHASCWSSRDLPGGAVLGVLEHYAHGGEFIADAVRLGEVLHFASSRTRSDQCLNVSSKGAFIMVKRNQRDGRMLIDRDI